MVFEGSVASIVELLNCWSVDVIYYPCTVRHQKVMANQSGRQAACVCMCVCVSPTCLFRLKKMKLILDTVSNTQIHHRKSGFISQFVVSCSGCHVLGYKSIPSSTPNS